MPARSRDQRPWPALAPSLQRTLRWLNACTLLPRTELCWLAWPAGASRQWRHLALRRWTNGGFIVPLDGGALYQLGRTGVGKLQEAGIAASTSTVPAPRVRPGLALAAQFAVALAREIHGQAGVTHFSWGSQPFQGASPRADATGVVCYQRDPLGPSAAVGDALLNLTLPVDASAPGQMRMQLMLEVDLGTETATQLAQRAARWGTLLRATRSQLPPRTWSTVLWVTSGGWDRAQTIWQTWLRHAAVPLFISTRAALTLDGRLCPWSACWRDEHGRPRTLNPYAGHERVWRFQPSPPPAALTLEHAIAAWEATQRAHAPWPWEQEDDHARL